MQNKSYLKCKAVISFDFFKSSASRGRVGGEGPPDPNGKSKCHYFRANMLKIWIGIADWYGE